MAGVGDQIVSRSKSFDGNQYVITHWSRSCRCQMTFAIFLPRQATTERVPLLYFLSGLGCTHQNAVDKAHYRQVAAELGFAVLCPDTSPRGDNVPDEADNWLFGQGASFYLNATQEPYTANYNMEDYIVVELAEVLKEYGFLLDFDRQGIFGHSMGGHGAISLALKHPGYFRSVSAFAPISQPSTATWCVSTYEKFLGLRNKEWRRNDSIALIEDGGRVDAILIDQGLSDPFLEDQLRTDIIIDAGRKANIPVFANFREGYDHSYYFVSTFMESHLRWHAQHIL